MNEFLNEGTFQEYDYNEEEKECDWKVFHQESNKILKDRKWQNQDCMQTFMQKNKE